MQFTADQIYSVAETTTESQFNNLYNLFTEKELKVFESLVKLGDSKNVALWTVVSERYSDKNSDIYERAYS